MSLLDYFQILDRFCLRRYTRRRLNLNFCVLLLLQCLALGSRTAWANPQVTPGGPAVSVPVAATSYSSVPTPTSGYLQGYQWNVLSPSGAVVATNSAPNGWTLPPSSSYGEGSYSIQAPAGAAVGTGYTLVWYYQQSYLGNFDVASAQPPAAPTGLAAVAGNAQVTLSWTASGGAASYSIYRGTSAGGEGTTPIATGITTTAYADANLTNGTSYYYTVMAVNALGSSPVSNEASATPQAPPPAPTGLTATAGNAQVALAWTAPAGSSLTYNVYRGTAAGGEAASPLNASPLTATAYVDTTAANGTTYYYTVQTVGAAGNSAASNEASATPHLPPAAPTGLTATPGDQQVSLSWDPMYGASGYNVYRTTSLGSGYALIPGSPFSGTSCTDTGLTDGTLYFYVVTEIIGGTEGPMSPPADAMPIAPDFSLSASPRSVGMVAGASQNANVMVAPIGGFSGSVSFTLTEMPAGVTGTFSTVDAVTTGLNFTVAAIVSPGLYYITVTGASGSLTHTVTVPLTVAPPAVLTSTQAIQAAQTFCQTIGAPVTGTASAQYPAPARYSGQQASYYLPRWLVTFTGTNGLQAEVEVVDSTSAVSRYYNFALSQQALSNNQPAGTPLSQATAIQDAITALQAAGQPADIAATPTSQNFQLTSPATSAGDLWMVTWSRQFQGIPYRQQQVTVMLQAETDAVQALSVTFPSPPPAMGAGTVTQDQATQTAQTLLASAGVSSPTLQACQQMVVQPNTFWQSGGSVSPQPNVAGQVAWDCVYTDANGMTDEVWVDTNSGGVIGGESYGLAGKRQQASATPKSHAATKATKPTARTPTGAKTPKLREQ